MNENAGREIRDEEMNDVVGGLDMDVDTETKIIYCAVCGKLLEGSDRHTFADGRKMCRKCLRKAMTESDLLKRPER